jgi:integrase
LSAAVREELVARNVAALVRVPVPRPKRAKAWTVDQARRFLESARIEDDPLYVAYVLLLVLGLRRGELLGLAWEDVDLDEATAWIGWQLQRVGATLLRRQTKTYASDAPLPLPDICVRALEHRRSVESRWHADAPVWHESGLVLTSRLGTPLEPRNFHRAFVDRAKRADVPVIPVHLTRKACASLLVALDVHPRVAMQILRHSQIAVTMEVYSQVVGASTKEALRRLGEQLDPRDMA